jgi:tetratricopeptide (TPR) repeat protein
MMRKTLIALMLLFALGLSAQKPVANETPWFVHYERGLDLISEGKGKEARAELEAAQSALTEPGLQVPTRLSRYIDYLPNLYLAIACHMSGDRDAAKAYLRRAEVAGVAAKSEAGGALMVAYQMLINEATPLPRYEMFDPSKEVLSDAEFDKLQAQVLAGAALREDMKMADAPWYVHYELALELEKKGDHSRAIASFVDALHRKPNPARHVRTYGMWLMDYYPYFHIAKNQAALENWNAAADAITISERLREIPFDAGEYNELERLRFRVMRYLK